jgi:hypothetical protein
VTAEFTAAIADPDRYGLAKTMALAVGLDQPEAIEAFLQGGPETLPDVDPGMVRAAMARQARLTALNAERKMPQLPVRLPAQEELAASGERSKVAGQFRALAAAKNIKPADARNLITLLGTGDESLKFRSAADLPGLNLVVSWALQARIIRRQGTRLLPVAKTRPLLTDAEALWQRAFEAAFAIGDAVCRPAWADEPPSPVQQTYDLVVPDVLATIYSMEEPVPVPRLAESVWLGVEATFDLDRVSSFILDGVQAPAQVAGDLAQAAPFGAQRVDQFVVPPGALGVLPAGSGCPGASGSGRAGSCSSGVRGQPVGQGPGVAPLDEVERGAGLDVDDQRAVVLAAADREVVDPQDPRGRRLGIRRGHDQPQQDLPGRGEAQPGGQPRSRAPGQRDRDPREHRGQQRRLARVPDGQAVDLLGERLARAAGGGAEEPPRRQHDRRGAAPDSGVGQRPGIAAMDPARHRPAPRARCLGGARPGRHEQQPGGRRDLLDDHPGQVRQQNAQVNEPRA